MIKTSPRARKQFRTNADRQLKDLAGVGPATLEDLSLLGVHSVAQLAEQDGTELYERLCSVTGVQHDVCCLDVFRCAVAQARDPELPEEQRNWWYWSRLRKKNVLHGACRDQRNARYPAASVLNPFDGSS